jgi:mersacidin/lichenicidin family type 2 lantibiotic
MSSDQVIRAWKNADYGTCLNPALATSVPAHPVGPIDLPDSALGVGGGSGAVSTERVETLGCCQGITQVGAGMCDLTAGGGIFVCTTLCMTIWFTTKSVCANT